LLLGVSYLLVSVNFKNPDLILVIVRSHMFFGAVLLWAQIADLLLKYD